MPGRGLLPPIPVLLFPILLLIPVWHTVTGGLADWAFFASCPEESVLVMAPSPWSCSQYALCLRGRLTLHACPPGTVFCRHSLACGWPSPRDVRRCYGSMDGYARAACRPRSSRRSLLPNPDSCALYIDCRRSGSAPEVTPGHVFECPYPALFSPLTRRCSSFRQAERLCQGRRVPKAPCDYMQYRQITPSQTKCLRQHPSCVGMRDGLHPVAWRGPQQTLYVKRCFKERTIDVISCELASGQKSNGTCFRSVDNLA